MPIIRAAPEPRPNPGLAEVQLIPGAGVASPFDFCDDERSELTFLSLRLAQAATIGISPLLAGGQLRDEIERQGEVAKTGRNEPCHCGSGKKFKRCCGT